MKIIVIGAGINGLVCANYLQRAGHQVTVIERKSQVGGCCSKATTELRGRQVDYPDGASVFGFMPDHIFTDTGIVKRVGAFISFAPDIVHFPGRQPVAYAEYLFNEMTNKWGEKGSLINYRNDLMAVVRKYQEGVKAGKVPFELDDPLWVQGSAKALLEKYFTSYEAQRFHAIPVDESGPVDWTEPYSAFNIVFMNSGSALGGHWGFIRDGIWAIPEVLTNINEELGVKLLIDTQVDGVHAKGVYADGMYISADRIVFATDPLTAYRIIERKAPVLRYTGDMSKMVLLYDQPIDLYSFHYVFEGNGYYEIYPEGPCRRMCGWDDDYDYLSVYYKERGQSKEAVENLVEGIIGEPCLRSIQLTPEDLSEKFYLPAGNVDHTELCQGQTLWSRTFSKNPKRFYQLEDTPYYYCGAASFPCGSVGGTAGYLCAQEILREE